MAYVQVIKSIEKASDEVASAIEVELSIVKPSTTEKRIAKKLKQLWKVLDKAARLARKI